MAKFDVDVGGKTYEVDASDPNQAWDWANQYHQSQQQVEGPGFGTRFGATTEALGRGLVGMAGTVATAPGAALGAAMAGGGISEIGEAASGAAGEVMEKVPRIFGETTKTAEEMIGKYLMELPMEYGGEAAVNLLKSPLAAGPGGLPAVASAKLLETLGIDPEAFMRTAGERGVEALLYSMGVGFLKGRAPKAPKEAPPKGPSITDLENLRKQTEAADSAKLQEFKDKAVQQEAFPETLRRETPEEIAFREESVKRQQATGQGELFIEEPRPERPVERLGRPDRPEAAKELPPIDFVPEKAPTPAETTRALDEISRIEQKNPEIPKEVLDWARDLVAKDPDAVKLITKVTPKVEKPLGEVIRGGKERGAIGDLTRKITQLPEQKEFAGPAFKVKTTGDIISHPEMKVHLQLLPEIKAKGFDFRNVEDGFIDKGGKFVSRTEAKMRWGSSISEDLQTMAKVSPRERGGVTIDPDLASRIRRRLGLEGPAVEQTKPANNFENWKANLPDEYKPMARQLFDQWEKNQKAKLAEEAKASPAMDSKNVGKLEGLGHWTPDLRSYEDVKVAFSQLKDTTRRGRLFAAGASMFATIKGHPALKWGTDWIKTAKDNAEARTFQVLSDSQKGWFPIFKQLPKAEQLGLFNKIIENNGLRWMTRDEMIREGFTNKQISAYESYHELTQKIWNDINVTRAIKGLDPVKDVSGYFPARWYGRYYVEIRSKDGRLLSVETSNKQSQLEGLQKKLSRDYSVSKIQSREAHNISERSDFKYRPLFDQIAETLGRDSFERIALDELIGQFYEGQGWKRSNFPRHFEPKSGVGGYRGAQAGLELTNRMTDGLRSLESYVRDAYDWSESQKAHKQIGDFLKDVDTSHLDNVKSYIEEYWNHAYKTPTQTAQFFRSIMQGLERQLEGIPLIGGRSIESGMHSLRRAAIVTMLGFYRPSFLISQIVQVPQMMLPALLELRARAPNAKYAHSQLGAFMMGTADALKATTGKLDPFAQKAYDYAVQNGIVHPRFLDDVRTVSDLSTWDNRIKWMDGEHLINMTEQTSRTVAYMQAIRALEGTLEGKPLYETARGIVDQAMTNYRPYEQAMAFSKLGAVGKLIDPLTTFKINYVNQMVKYTKLALENPASAKHWAPLAAQLYISFLLGGLMGITGLKEVDFVIDMMKKAGWLDPNTNNASSFILKQSEHLQGKGRDFLRWGMFSGLTGANLTPHFSTSQIVPHSWREILPVPSKVADVAGAAASSIGPGGSLVDLMALGKELPGGIPQGLAEYARTTPQGILQQPEKNLEGGIRRRTDMPDPYRMAGTRSIPEAEEMEGMRQNKQHQAILQQRRSVALDQAKELYLTGKTIDAPLKQYLDAGGDPNTFVNEIIHAFEKSQTTNMEREGMRLRTIQQLRNWQNLQSYGAPRQ